MPTAGTDPKLSRCGYGTAQEVRSPRTEIPRETNLDTATERMLFQRNMITDIAPAADSALSAPQRLISRRSTDPTMRGNSCTI